MKLRKSSKKNYLVCRIVRTSKYTKGAGKGNDYGRFWAIFFEIKSKPEIAENIPEMYWFSGPDAKEGF